MDIRRLQRYKEIPIPPDNNSTSEPNWTFLNSIYQPRSSGHIVRHDDGRYILRESYSGAYRIYDSEGILLKNLSSGSIPAGDSYNQTRPSGTIMNNVTIDGVYQGDCAIFRNWYSHANIVTHLEDMSLSSVISTMRALCYQCPDVNRNNNTIFLANDLRSSNLDIPPIATNLDITSDDYVWQNRGNNVWTYVNAQNVAATLKPNLTDYTFGAIYFGTEYAAFAGILNGAYVCNIYKMTNYNHFLMPEDNPQAFVRRITMPCAFSSQGQSLNIYENILYLLSGYNGRGIWAFDILTGETLDRLSIPQYTWNRLHWKNKTMTVGEKSNQVLFIEFDTSINKFNNFTP